jgi:2-isopropylmalate synthase
MRDVREMVRTVEYCNQLPVHPRHPYGGELVFTAFSGSHQDAIKKGFAALEKSNSQVWEVPYLPIDPKDIGRDYEAVIRVNSQSGKGGVAYLLEAEHGIELPRRMQIEFAGVIQRIADETGKEITADSIWREFQREYLGPGKLDFVEHVTLPQRQGNSVERKLEATLRIDGAERTIAGQGNGPIAAYVDALEKALGLRIEIVDYREHALSKGSDAKAIAYVEANVGGRTIFGCGMDPNIVSASLRAVTSVANRCLRG